MGRRDRQRSRLPGPLGAAAPATYTDPEGNALILRTKLSPGTRRKYAQIASGAGLPPAATREDAWQRSVEFLFERLAVSWTIAGAPPLTAQRELLGRLRMASSAERSWLRDRLREHCAEHFPELAAP
jgi:hypothetical protein